ncbi:hypothetical protein RHMOL_Rhmol13G0090900 [Rhododendron molle]|uniref:Uncharacterized protein n=1 Tax=Rhododendron molle TaxID=49168 RepID=A0ACC0L622_RHOML|nr:hypothetical protein RHMOL_Rhmol13G0090900 [Rhododendron molle]
MPTAAPVLLKRFVSKDVPADAPSSNSALIPIVIPPFLFYSVLSTFQEIHMLHRWSKKCSLGQSKPCIALTIVDNPIPLVGYHLAESGQTSQGLTSQPQQTSLADSKRHCQPVDLSDIITLRMRSSSCETLEMKKVAPAESGRKSKNSTGSGYGSNSVPVAADCPSETSSPICKSFDKLSHSPDSGNKDEGKTSSSDSRTNHATADTKTWKVKGSRHF